ncbi:MAG: lysine--tRNA ligase, partial [Thermoplasmataceae archaeon]
MHWADAFVQDLAGQQTISTGISPSGPIHVGNMREILTGNFIYVAARDKGLEARFIYLCDDIDPLRKVYPFLDSSFSKYVGWPLYRIPAPQGEGTYSEYFLRPFLDTLDTINV